MSLKKNIVANYLGQGWVAIMAIAFVPWYVRYLGVEGYGLIGVYSALQAWMAVMDLGLGPTLTREVARSQAGAQTRESIRDLLRSMEWMYLGLGVTTLGAGWILAPSIAQRWLHADQLPVSVVVDAIRIMMLVAVFRWFEGLFRSALIGLQRQVLLNASVALFATLRGAGVLGILAWVSPTIGAFFWWQALVSLASLATLVWICYATLPPAPRSVWFSRSALASVWRFSAGVMVTTTFSVLLMQLDKVLLTALLPLESFGYYALAQTACAAIFILTVPITQAFAPKLTELTAVDGASGLRGTYHLACQTMTVVISAPALILAFHPGEIVRIWSGDPALAAAVAPLVTPLMLGWLCNALTNVPYCLQLAHGWSSLTAAANATAAVILVPALLFVVPRYGAMGAAYLWLILNAGYVLIIAHLMHRRILVSEKWRWYCNDILVPLLAAAAPIAALAPFGASFHDGYAALLYYGILGLAGIALSGLSAPELRARALRYARV
jgi:O-antigen/teichoic acid export membrane protein